MICDGQTTAAPLVSDRHLFTFRLGYREYVLVTCPPQLENRIRVRRRRKGKTCVAATPFHRQPKKRRRSYALSVALLQRSTTLPNRTN